MRDYEDLVRKLIKAGNESPKVDFKREADFSKRNIVDLARLAIAMANSDSDEFDDTGYIILGAERGRLVGGVDQLANDAVCASLPRRLNNYITPNARIEVQAFQDADKGWFGVILVRPAPMTRPHFVAREYADHSSKLHIRRNECYVRVGESIELASRDDFDRLYQPKLEWQLRAAEGRLEPQPEPSLFWLDRQTPTERIVMPPTAPLEQFDAEIVVDDSFSEPEISQLPEEQAARARDYNENLRQYRDAVAEHAEELRRYRRIDSNLNVAGVCCDVDGERPLLDYHVYLFFPEGFEVFRSNRAPQGPSLPARPLRPRLAPKKDTVGLGLHRLGLHGLDRVLSGDLVGSQSVFPNLEPLSSVLDPTKGGLYVDVRGVWGWAEKTKHGFRTTFSPVLVVPPTTEDTYEIGYEISAENLPKPVRGVLKIKVVAGAERAIPETWRADH